METYFTVYEWCNLFKGETITLQPSGQTVAIGPYLADMLDRMMDLAILQDANNHPQAIRLVRHCGELRILATTYGEFSAKTIESIVNFNWPNN
jgi:hypothetical protein